MLEEIGINAGSSAAQQIIGAGIQAIEGGHSARKQARYQQALNQQMALWNKENITDPNFAMENAEWERRFQMQNEQWREQQDYLNEYNTPANQVKRLREAGVNPAGIGSVQNPIAQGADVSAPYTPQAAGYPAQTPQVQNWEQASLMRAQTANINANTLKQQQETKRQQIENNYLDNYWNGVLDTQAADIALKRGTKDLTEAQKREVESNMKYIDQKTENAKQEMQLITEQLAKTSQEILNMKSNKEYQDKVNAWFEKNKEAEIKEIYQHIRTMAANETEAYKNAEMLYAMERKYLLEGDYQDLQNSIEQLTYDAKIKGIRAQWHADTARFTLDSHNYTWLDSKELYKAGRQLEDLVKYSEYVRNRTNTINNEVGVGPLKIKYGTIYDEHQAPWQYTAGQWGSSGQ